MQKITLLLFMFFSSMYALAQSDSLQLVYTNSENWVKGAYIKSVDYYLSNFKTFDGSYIGPMIRKVQGRDGKPTFFYSINNGVSLNYSDLLKMIEALETLKGDVAKDVEQKPDYLDNNYTNLKGFCVGYFVRMDRIKKTWFVTWYLLPDESKSDQMLTFKDVSVIEAYFNKAKAKIDELKAKER